MKRSSKSRKDDENYLDRDRPRYTEDIIELGEEIRELWIARHNHQSALKSGRRSGYVPGPRWDGGRLGEKQYEAFWPKAAQFVRAHELDPVAFVKAQFLNDSPHAVVSPSALTTQAAISRYFTYTMEYPTDHQLELRLQVTALESALFRAADLYPDRKQALAAVLLDSYVTMSPLFRYCVAYHEQLPEVMQTWHKLARRQYFRTPKVFDTVWAGYVPDTIRTTRGGKQS